MIPKDGTNLQSFYTGHNTKDGIDTNGYQNVNIGNTSPSHKLSVSGV